MILGGMNWQYFFVTFQIKSLIIKSYITVPAFRHIFNLSNNEKKKAKINSSSRAYGESIGESINFRAQERLKCCGPFSWLWVPPLIVAVNQFKST